MTHVLCVVRLSMYVPQLVKHVEKEKATSQNEKFLRNYLRHTINQKLDACMVFHRLLLENGLGAINYNREVYMPLNGITLKYIFGG